MPRAPRFIPAGSMVEITTRTIAGRFLLTPSPELNLRILSIVGRALALYPVALHAFVFLSNHWHALATVADAARAAQFVGYVNGHVARAIQELHGWSGPLWSRRAEIIPVIDDQAAEGRLQYILSHGVKEGLVASPLDWPGVSSARALALGEPLEGRWRRRSRRGARGTAENDTIRYAIELVPIPSHAALSVDDWRCRIRAMIDDVVAQGAARHPAPLGVPQVLAQDPLAAPETFLQRRAPRVHAAFATLRQEFLAIRAAFVDAFREAARTMVSAARTLAATFPPGAFPAPLPPSPAVERRERGAEVVAAANVAVRAAAAARAVQASALPTWWPMHRGEADPHRDDLSTSSSPAQCPR